jgi:hypothetical protein
VLALLGYLEENKLPSELCAFIEHVFRKNGALGKELFKKGFL